MAQGAILKPRNQYVSFIANFWTETDSFAQLKYGIYYHVRALDVFCSGVKDAVMSTYTVLEIKRRHASSEAQNMARITRGAFNSPTQHSSGSSPHHTSSPARPTSSRLAPVSPTRAAMQPGHMRLSMQLPTGMHALSGEAAANLRSVKLRRLAEKQKAKGR